MMVLQQAGADFGALQVLKNTDGAAFLLGRVAQAFDGACVVGVRSVGEVQASDVHAELHQFAQRGLGAAGRADGANDFGPAAGNCAGWLALRTASDGIETLFVQWLTGAGSGWTILPASTDRRFGERRPEPFRQSWLRTCDQHVLFRQRILGPVLALVTQRESATLAVDSGQKQEIGSPTFFSNEGSSCRIPLILRTAKRRPSWPFRAFSTVSVEEPHTPGLECRQDFSSSKCGVCQRRLLRTSSPIQLISQPGA